MALKSNHDVAALFMPKVPVRQQCRQLPMLQADETGGGRYLVCKLGGRGMFSGQQQQLHAKHGVRYVGNFFLGLCLLFPIYHVRWGRPVHSPLRTVKRVSALPSEATNSNQLNVLSECRNVLSESPAIRMFCLAFVQAEGTGAHRHTRLVSSGIFEICRRRHVFFLGDTAGKGPSSFADRDACSAANSGT